MRFTTETGAPAASRAEQRCGFGRIVRMFPASDRRAPRASWSAGLLLATLLVGLACGASADIVLRHAGDANAWPPGTYIVPFERVGGLILFRSTLGSAARGDTSGWMLLDTGAGHLALDQRVARSLGLDPWIGEPGEVTATRLPLERLSSGDVELSDVSPVLAIDAGPLSPRIDRPLLGLFAPALLEDRTLVVDYRQGIWGAVPRGFMVRTPDTTVATIAANQSAGSLDRVSKSRATLSTLLTTRSVAIPFRLLGDDKIVVSARIADPSPPDYSRPLTLVLDTGADACYFDQAAFRARVRTSESWPWLRDLRVATVYGEKRGAATALPSLELLGASGSTSCSDVIAMVTDDGLLPGLERSVGERVDGLLGYTFLQHFRMLIDYPNRVLWLDRAEASLDDEAPFGLTAAGIQVARVQDRLRIVGVAEGTEASRALALGDEITSIDGAATARMTLGDAQRLLEGPDGSRVRLVVRREKVEVALELTRRRLL